MSWGKQNKVKKGLLKAQINGKNFKKIFEELMKNPKFVKLKPLPCVEDHKVKLEKLRQIQSTNTENKLPIINLKAIHPLFNKK